jgi:outer membrane immunogenic protein
MSAGATIRNMLMRRSILGERPMIKLTCGALVFGLLSSTAVSAQHAPAPIWQGIYLGADLGGATRSSEQISLTSGNVQKATHSPGIGGVFAGYNWQFGSWVAGVEGDVTRSGGNGGMMPTLRGRVGWAFDNTLLYATAGVGTQGVSLTRTATGEKVGHQFVGLVVGGGAETKLTRNWGLRGEVFYYDAGKQRYDFAPSGGFGGNAATLSFDKIMYRVGLSYQFN